MKKIFLTLCVMVAAITASAQKMPVENLNETMARYYEGCTYLRDGVEKNSLTRLERAAELLDESKDNPGRINLQNIVLEYVAAVADTVSMKDHMYFCGDYAEYLYGEKDTEYVDRSPALRGIPGEEEVSECYVGQDAVKARGKISYNMAMAGNCKIFAVAEPGGGVRISVKDSGNGMVYEGTSYDDGAVSYVEWDQSGESSNAVLTVENTSDRDTSFAIASN